MGLKIFNVIQITETRFWVSRGGPMHKWPPLGFFRGGPGHPAPPTLTPLVVGYTLFTRDFNLKIKSLLSETDAYFG